MKIHIANDLRDLAFALTDKAMSVEEATKKLFALADITGLLYHPLSRSTKMSNNPSFTTREQYFAWRDAWRFEYNNLSIAIRTLKGAIVETMKRGEFAGSEQNRLIALRGQARHLLFLRQISKIRAGLIRKMSVAELSELTQDALSAQISIVYEIQQQKIERKRVASQAIAKAGLNKKVSKKLATSAEMAA